MFNIPIYNDKQKQSRRIQHQFYYSTTHQIINQSRMQQSEDSGITHESTKISESSEGVIQPSSSQPSLKDHMSQQQKKRCEQILTSFKKMIQTNQESDSNKFTVVNPPLWIIARLVDMWMSRPQKSLKNTITLELKNVNLGQHTEKIIEGLFMVVGSIKLIVNEKEVKLKAIFSQYGDYIYEGIEEKMNVYSHYQKSDYIGQVKKISEGEYRYHGKGRLLCGNKKDGFEYIGQFDNGKRHGEGMMKMRMSLYEGEFKNDFMHGKGRETIFKLKKKNVPQPTFIKQYIYEGNFKEGYRHGYGQQIKNGKYSFKGNWQRGVKCGQGKIEYNNQDTYDGEWENNLFNGKGIYVEKGNCVYEGEFKDGKYHGKGVMSYCNGDRYEGEFEYGKKHGQGKYDWKEKNDQQDYYDGMWKNDSAEGPGTSMIKGQFYNGDFKNGKRHGEGQLNTLDGDYIRAIFDQGEIVRYIQKNGQIVDQ